jgi:hypothetical protein
MKVGFVSFAGGDIVWKLAAKRIKYQARSAGVFTEVKIFNPRDLKMVASGDDYDFIITNKRGFGYWLWKPILVLEFLNNHPEIDVVLYVDAGCDLNFNASSRRTWDKYLGYLESNNGIAFKMELIENSWTKQEVFNQFSEFENFRNSEQLLAGVFMMGRQFAVDFCHQWLETMRTSGYCLLDDNYDESIQKPGFLQHRHDQSIFSLMTKQNGKVLILDSFKEVYFEPDWWRGFEFPIWTSRNKSYVPRYETGHRGQLIRVLERVLKKLLNFLQSNK